MSGCMNKCTIKPQQVEIIEDIKEDINDLKGNIPPSLIERCEWFYPFNGSTKEDLAKTNKINAERFERCYYLNESKAKYLELMRNSND